MYGVLYAQFTYGSHVYRKSSFSEIISTLPPIRLGTNLLEDGTGDALATVSRPHALSGRPRDLNRMRRRGEGALRCHLEHHASVCLFVALLASAILGVSAAAPANKGGNPAEAAAAFELNRFGSRKGGPLMEHKVFSKEKPVCPEGKDTSACFVDGKYIDRASFTFKFRAYDNASTIAAPNVSVKEKGALEAQVKDFVMSKKDGTGSFFVRYGCQKANTTATVTLSMQISAKHEAKVTWSKVCGGGKNEHLTISSSDLVMKPPLILPEAGPMQVSTVIELKTGFPQLSLDFKKPYLVSKSADIGVKLRATLNEDTLSIKPKQFVVIYDCKTKTRGVISLTMAIPPWNNATLSWTKDCGGGHPDKLLVELGDQVVVNSTGVAQAFNVSEDTTLRSAADGIIYNLDVSRSKLDFVITNQDSMAYHIQGATTTVLEPEVLAVVSKSDWWSFGKSYLQGDKEHVLEPNEYVHMKIDMVCLTKGSAVVLVTLPILQYRNVEFGFWKECERPHVFHHSGVMRTATSLEVLFAVALVVAAVCGYRAYLRGRDNSGGKYEQVSPGGNV